MGGHFAIIGASLSEPHIYETCVRDLFIYLYGTTVTGAAPLIHNTLCAFQNTPRNIDRML